MRKIPIGFKGGEEKVLQRGALGERHPIPGCKLSSGSTAERLGQGSLLGRLGVGGLVLTRIWRGGEGPGKPRVAMQRQPRAEHLCMFLP